MSVTYKPSQAELNELERLKKLWEDAINGYNIMITRYGLLSTFMNSVILSDASMNQRIQLFNDFQLNNNWFDWGSWFNNIPIANSNVDRTAYLNYYSILVDQQGIRVNKNKDAYTTYKALLDAKEADLIGAQSGVIAAELDLKNTELAGQNIKYVVGVIVFVIVIYFGFKLLRF